MKPPTPDDLTLIPVWECYVSGQALQACLGIIPAHALAIAVVPSGLSVEFWFQMTVLTDQDQEDINDIISEFHTLTGYVLEVSQRVQITDRRLIEPVENLWWIYMHRAQDQ